MGNSYAQYVTDQLSRALPVRTRAMFGAVGVYSNDLFFAIVTDEAVYFKVDDSNRGDYEAAGMEQFRPYGDDRTMAYWQVPERVLEDPDELRRWAERSVDVARKKRK